MKDTKMSEENGFRSEVIQCHMDPKYRTGIPTQVFGLTPLPFHNTWLQVWNHELNTFLPYYLQTVPLNNNNSMWGGFLKENCIKMKAKSTYFDTFQMHQ